MMKSLILFLLGLAAIATASHPKQEVEDPVFLERQKDILKLFKFINQPSYYKDFLEVASKFPVQDEQYYSKPEVVKQFFNLYSKGFLPKGEIFSIYLEKQQIQAIALYKLFYYAKDFDSFLKVAIWARQNINEGMFVYIVSVALVQRPDSQQFKLPPIYEIYPQYFFSSEIIQQAQIYKQQLMIPSADQTPQTYIINANYSGYYSLSKENVLSYFTEDIGINAFYYYYNMYYPFWLDESMSLYQSKRPLYYSIMYPQILARYYLERLSNGLGQIPYLDFDKPVLSGFYSSLRYPSGLEFPVRPESYELMKPVYMPVTPNNYNYTMALKLLQEYSRRIMDAIDLGYFINTKGEKVLLKGPEGLKTIINVIQGNPESPNLRFYGSLPRCAKHVFGYSYSPLDLYKGLPSVLELTETSLRDPMFYQLYQTIFYNVYRYLSYEPLYTYEDLLLSGVKIQEVDIDRLTTYYDYFYSDITNALYVNKNEFEADNIQVQVRQERLNHKPFSYKVQVLSAEEQQVLVKVYLGPKYDEYNKEIDMYEYYYNFLLLDSFDYKLQTGQNTLERSSKQFPDCVPDMTSYRDMYYRIMAGTYDFKSEVPIFGFPNRVLLPKGAPNGQIYQLYVFISQSKSMMPVLYPLDKFAEYNAYTVPNAYSKDVVIYFKEFSEINRTH